MVCVVLSLCINYKTTQEEALIQNITKGSHWPQDKEFVYSQAYFSLCQSVLNVAKFLFIFLAICYASLHITGIAVNGFRLRVLFVFSDRVKMQYVTTTKLKFEAGLKKATRS